MPTNNSNIIILGCGLSGMLTALTFAKQGIKTTIIEARNTKNTSFFDDIRTTALTSASKAIFVQIDIWEDVEKIAGAINDIYVADNKSPQMLHFASSELKAGEIMGYLVENTKFKKLLFEFVSSNPLISILDESPYSKIENTNEYGSITTLNGTRLVCDLIVICDGRNSLAKQRFFSNVLEKQYQQHAITFIAEHEKPHQGTAFEHFMVSGPFATLPLQSEHHSSVVWTVPAESAKALIELDPEEFNFLVQENFGSFLGKVTIKSKVASFPLIAYSAQKYYNKRLVLVADTAHVIHPLAGQGLNQGIKDISTLIDMISQFGANSHALSAYEKLRRQDNSIMLEITDTLNALFSNDSEILREARQIGFKAIESFPPFKKLLIKYAMGKR